MNIICHCLKDIKLLNGNEFSLKVRVILSKTLFFHICECVYCSIYPFVMSKAYIVECYELLESKEAK